MNANSIVIKVHRKIDTIRDVQERIIQALGYPQGYSKLVILLRHEPFVSAKKGSATSIRSEVYNLTWRLVKTVDEGPKLESFSSYSDSLT